MWVINGVYFGFLLSFLINYIIISGLFKIGYDLVYGIKWIIKKVKKKDCIVQLEQGEKVMGKAKQL